MSASKRQQIKQVRKQVTDPQRITYGYHPAYTYMPGTVTVVEQLEDGTHECTRIPASPIEQWQMVVPQDKDEAETVRGWWIPTYEKHYIAPDVIMVDEHCYTTYIHLL